MLANKAKLGYKATSSASTYTDLAGLKSIPELGADPTLVDNTCLTDTYIYNELGIGDAGQLDYVFRFSNTAGSAYRTLTGLTAGTTYYWQQEMADGTKYAFSGPCSVKVGGGGVNEPIEFTLTIALQSGISVTNPASQ